MDRRQAIDACEDADTTGAVFGQLAGAHYGLSGIPMEWKERLAQRDMIEQFQEKLLANSV